MRRKKIHHGDTEEEEKEEYLATDFTDLENSFCVLEAEFWRSQLLINSTSSATDYLHNPF